MKKLICTLIWLSVWAAPLHAQDETLKKKEDKAQEIKVEMVVSASRRSEKKLEAPATIETITPTTLEEAAVVSPYDSAAGMKGVNFVKGGVNYQRVSARGFDSSYSSRMLWTVDGKLSTLPGAGTPQTFLQPTVGLDISGVEVILGPAAALYGANASAGVFNTITKSPWDEAGTSTSFRVGEQSLVDFQLRHAGLSKSGKFAWKLVGEVLDAKDFGTDNVYFVDGSNQTSHTDEEVAEALEEGTAYREDDLASLDVKSKKYAFTGYYSHNDFTFSGNYAWSRNTALTPTNLGRNFTQFDIQEYGLELQHPKFYFHWKHTYNEGTGTFGVQNVPVYLSNGFTLEEAANDPKLAGVFDESLLDDYELQGNHAIGDLNLIAGISYRDYAPDSAGTYLDDFLDDDGTKLAPINRTEKGAYAQADWRLMQKWRLTAALRHDNSNEYESQTSPKFSVTYNSGNHNWRLGYNKAHRDPSILENHLFFAGGVALGNGRGWSVQDLVTGEITSFPALAPEIVETIELGYRGIFRDSLFIDAVVYSSDYEHFISPLQLIADARPNPNRNPTVGIDADGGVHPVVLTYLNFGKAKVRGADIGFDYYRGAHFHANFSYGYSELESFTNNTVIPDLPFNAPGFKHKGFLAWNDFFVENTFLKVAYRYIDDYEYHSGRWNGVIGKGSVVDFATGFKWLKHKTNFKVSVSNLLNKHRTDLLGIPPNGRLVSFGVTRRF